MENNTDDFLKPLEELKKVETPAFLFTRVQQRIENDAAVWISPNKVWSFVSIFVLLLFLNIYAIKQVRSGSHEKNLAETFHLMPNNNLYE